MFRERPINARAPKRGASRRLALSSDSKFMAKAGDEGSYQKGLGSGVRNNGL